MTKKITVSNLVCFAVASIILQSADVVAQGKAPNCYQIADFDKKSMDYLTPKDPAAFAARYVPKREFFWILDETTPFSSQLYSDAYEIAKRQVHPGDAIYVASFSYNGVDLGVERYLKPLFEYKLDVPIDEKKDKVIYKKIGQETLRSYSNCLSKQQDFVQKRLLMSALSVKASYSATISKSDILYSLREISARVKASKATEKVVFISSDMLENSSVTSFYKNGIARKILPSYELAKPDVVKMKGDFGGAKVFVFGAGVVGESDTKSIQVLRDTQTIDALKDFWQVYFKSSNANLVEFGHPRIIGTEIYPN